MLLNQCYVWGKKTTKEGKNPTILKGMCLKCALAKVLAFSDRS